MRESMHGLDELLTTNKDWWLKAFTEPISMYEHEEGDSSRFVYRVKGKAIGALEMSKDYVAANGDVVMRISAVFVRESWRRQGIATALIEEARRRYTVIHSNERSDDGNAWAKAVG